MGIINGMTTVNGGRIVSYNNSQVEVLGPSISGHKDNMIVSYAIEGSRIVSMVYDGKAFYIFRFKTHSELQHYWSTKMNVNRALESRKYSQMAKYTISAYNDLVK